MVATKEQRAQITQELEQIRSKNERGVLEPEEVVKFAKNPKTALHGRFTWDDGQAAYQYRLWQARQVIRCHVTILEQADGKPVRTYVSLMNDRKQQGGGYRPLVNVLSDDDQRAALLQEALAELAVFEEKYKVLSELAPVFAAVERVARRAKKRAKLALAGS